MTKKDALYKLEDAKDLIIEAKYMIEEIIPQSNILDVKNVKILDEVTDLIKLLSEIQTKSGEKSDLPIEGVYKLLYSDYKKTLKEKKELQEDILNLMKDKEWDKDIATLNLKLIRSERDIEKLYARLEKYKNKIEKLKEDKRHLKRILKDNNISINDSDEEDDNLE